MNRLNTEYPIGYQRKPEDSKVKKRNLILNRSTIRSHEFDLFELQPVFDGNGDLSYYSKRMVIISKIDKLDIYNIENF